MTKSGGLVSAYPVYRKKRTRYYMHCNYRFLTIGKGWDYYKNLTTEDFILNFNLGKCSLSMNLK